MNPLESMSDEELVQNWLASLSDEELKAYHAAQSQQKEVHPLMEPVGLAEVGLHGLTSAAGNVLGYPLGVGATMLADKEAGEYTRKSVADALTYEPRSDAAKQQMQALGELFAPITEVVAPYLKEETEALGRGVEELAGSETAGFAAQHLPQTALEASALYGAGQVAKGAYGAMTPDIELLDVAGNPTLALRKLLDKKGLSFEALTPEAKAMIPRTIQRGTKGETGTAIQTRDVGAGGTQAGSAHLMLDDMNVVKDPAANFAIKQGWEPNFVSSLKKTNPITKSRMMQMLRRRARIEADLTALKKEGRPSDIVGNVMMDRLAFIDSRMKSANNQLDTIANKDFKGVPVDPAPVNAVLAKHMDKLGITYRLDEMGNPITNATGKPQFDFSRSDLLKVPGGRRQFNDLLDLMDQAGVRGLDAHSLHRMKRQIDSMVNWAKTSKSGIAGEAERFAKEMRGTINAQLRELNPQYAKVNDILSEGIAINDTIKGFIRKADNLGEDASAAAMGTASRKLFSNYGVRAEMDQAIKQMDDFVKRLQAASDSRELIVSPGKPKGVKSAYNDAGVDIYDLAQFSAYLDRRFGAVGKTTFKGEIENAGELAKKGLLRSKGEMALDAVIGAANKIKGVSDIKAFQAMEDLLRSKYK